ncbi:hypothetical protein [uncultured Campylobacter sp.]|nr:hypothetical protein [uncultured Campylobacter sp.]
MKFYRLGPVNLDKISSKFNARPKTKAINFKISNPREISPRALKKFQIS